MGYTSGMNPPAASARYTWDDFIALEEDDLRELIDGELVGLVRGEPDLVVEAADEVFRPDGFEGLEIPLAKLWE